MSIPKLIQRRERVFGIAVVLAGMAISSLCLMPTLLADTLPESLFQHVFQERYFFNIFGIVCGCWLLCWVSAVNHWRIAARTGQWAAVIMLCAAEALLVAVWRDVMLRGPEYLGVWLSPLVVQIYLLGCLFGIFTLPSLTDNGNLRLTGLGTLVLLLPWLFARDSVAAGAEYLHGLML